MRVEVEGSPDGWPRTTIDFRFIARLFLGDECLVTGLYLDGGTWSEQESQRAHFFANEIFYPRFWAYGGTHRHGMLETAPQTYKVALRIVHDAVKLEAVWRAVLGQAPLDVVSFLSQRARLPLSTRLKPASESKLLHEGIYSLEDLFRPPEAVDRVASNHFARRIFGAYVGKVYDRAGHPLTAIFDTDGIIATIRPHGAFTGYTYTLAAEVPFWPLTVDELRKTRVMVYKAAMRKDSRYVATAAVDLESYPAPLRIDFIAPCASAKVFVQRPERWQEFIANGRETWATYHAIASCSVDSSPQYDVEHWIANAPIWEGSHRRLEDIFP